MAEPAATKTPAKAEAAPTAQKSLSEELRAAIAGAEQSGDRAAHAALVRIENAFSDLKRAAAGIEHRIATFITGL